MHDEHATNHIGPDGEPSRAPRRARARPGYRASIPPQPPDDLAGRQDPAGRRLPVPRRRRARDRSRLADHPRAIRVEQGLPGSALRNAGPAMTMPASRPRGTRQALAGREFAVGHVARPDLATVAWRWRYELILTAVVSVAAAFLAAVIGALGTILVIAAIAALIALAPPLRAEAAAFVWWIVTPHRVRTGMAQAWIHSRDGKIPVVLRTTRQGFGERVHVWCRAGTSAEDFAWASHLIAAACWAREVRVSRSARYPHVVVLDIVRRDASRPDEPRRWSRASEKPAGWRAV